MDKQFDCAPLGMPLTARLTGKIDRIERWGSQVCILDYKTGKVEPKDVTIKSWDELATGRKKGKAMQLALYGYALRDRYPAGAMSTGIFSLALPHKEPHVLKLGNEPVRFESDDLASIGRSLEEIFGNMLDPEVPFTHRPDAAFCCYCK